MLDSRSERRGGRWFAFGVGVVLALMCSGPLPANPDDGADPGFKETGKPATVDGELKRVCCIDEKGRAVEKWFVVGAEAGSDDPDKTYSVHFGKGKPDHLSTGARVSATGNLNGSALSVSSGREESKLKVTSQPVAAPVGGSASVTAIIVNFPGNVQSCTPADVNWMLNQAPNSLASYYPEASSGSFSVSASCKAAVTVEYSDDVWTVAARADQAANVSSGYRMYILAPGGWGWAGLGELGGKRNWINTLTGWMLVYTHEFGHNLGMHHAGWGGEYGDHSCTMGNPGVPPLLNGPHKVQMGWVSPTSVSTNGVYTYTLTHLEVRSGVQVLKIPKTDTGENYYVSYRAPVGLDAANLGAGFHYCTSVHTWYGGMGLTWMAAVLSDGQTFSDPVNGVTVTQVGHDATTSTVQVVLQAPAKPVASISTSSSGRGKAPLTVTFDGSASHDPDGAIVGYTWYMPGGTTLTNTTTVSWTFTTSGTYYITLVVTDNQGFTGTANAKVRVR